MTHAKDFDVFEDALVQSVASVYGVPAWMLRTPLPTQQKGDPTSAQTIRIKVITETGPATSDHIDYIEMPRDEWDAMSEQERDKEIQEVGLGPISVTAVIVDDDDQPTGEEWHP